MQDSNQKKLTELEYAREEALIEKVRAENQRFAAETKRLEDENKRANEVHALQMQKIREEELAKASGENPPTDPTGQKVQVLSNKLGLYFLKLFSNPAFLGFLAPVIAALIAFWPQIQHHNAIYNKEILEQEQTNLIQNKEFLLSEQVFLNGQKDSYKETIDNLNDQRNKLISSNQLILADAYLQKSNFLNISAQMIALTNTLIAQAKQAELEYQSYSSEKSNLMFQVSALRAERRELETKVIGANLDKVLGKVDDCLTLIDRDKTYMALDWDKESTDIDRQLTGEWQTNVYAKLNDEVRFGTNHTDRAKIAAAFVLYHHDGVNSSIWRDYILDELRTNRIVKFYLNLFFDYDVATNKLGYWRKSDALPVWSVYFKLMCSYQTDPDQYQPILNTIGGNYFFYKNLTDSQFEQLCTNECDVKALIHKSLLLQLDSLGAHLFPAASSLEFFKNYDPLLLAVMSSRSLAALPASIVMTNMFDYSSGYNQLGIVLGHWGYSDDKHLKERFDRLQIPHGYGANGVFNRVLDPARWKTWVADTNNTKLINAAMSLDLSDWNREITDRLK